VGVGLLVKVGVIVGGSGVSVGRADVGAGPQAVKSRKSDKANTKWMDLIEAS
jgi:hypothetical protein